jgi:tetratricopeptide (TPR) repeat protein
MLFIILISFSGCTNSDENLTSNITHPTITLANNTTPVPNLNQTEIDQNVHKINKSEIKELLYKAEGFSKQHNILKALDGYNKVLAIDPKNVEAWYNRGLIYANTWPYIYNYVFEANNAFDHVLEVEPRNVDAWLNKGNVFKSANECSKAIDAYNRVLAINPDNKVALKAKYDCEEELRYSRQFNYQYDTGKTTVHATKCGTCPVGYSGPDANCKCMKASCGCVKYAYN